MTNQNYVYQPKVVNKIVVRPFTFAFPHDLDPKWVPGNDVRALLFNGLSLTMPYLEPFLVKTMREVSTEFTDPELLEDIRGFNGQEANHYKCHRRLNELLKANGYPVLATVEKRLAVSYEKLHKRSMRTKLAYSAGFECMTNGFTNWLIDKRSSLFAGASPEISSFWLMHMVEEAEHKTVAYDVYMAYSGRYLPRAIGVFHGSCHVVGFGIVGMIAALKQDGVLWRPRTLLGIVRELSSVLWNVSPYLFRALLPNHNPRREGDPQWMLDWLAGHAEMAEGSALPLIDTNDPDMPVPFPAS